MSFYDIAIDYVEKYGLSVIPVGRDKRPLIKWEVYMSRKPTEKEIEEWGQRFPDANIGIVTGAVSGIVVVDADNDEAVKLLYSKFPVTAVYAKTSKGMHGYFKHPGGRVQNGVRVLEGLDIRGDGGYVVAPPSIHESGVVYEWNFTPYLDGFNELALFEFSGGYNAFDFNDTELQKQPIKHTNVSKGNRNNELARIAGERIGRGESLKDTILYMAGCNLTFNPPLSIKEVETIANSVYKTHLRNNPSEASIKQANVQSIEIKRSIPKGYTQRVLKPGGLMQNIMDFMAQCSPIFNPIYALGAVIPLVGSLIGLKYQTETGLKTNMYCINVGVSGSGKDGPQNAISTLLRRTSAYDVLGANELSSSTAILKELEYADFHTLFDIYDEIGLLLTSFKDKTGVKKDVPSVMMRLFSSAGRNFKKTYAEKEKNIKLNYSHFSFLGSSTPLRFWESITSSEATDGFMSRMLLFISEIEPDMPQKRLNFRVPDELAGFITLLWDKKPNVGHIHKRDEKQSDKDVEFVEPETVDKTPDAKKFFYEWAEKYKALSLKYSKINEMLHSIYSRCAEHAHKLALIHAISLQIVEPYSVGIESVMWATETVDCCVNNLVAGMADNLADNEFERWNLKVKALIRKYVEKWGDGRPGAPLSFLNNNLKYLQVKDLEAVIKKLEANGEVEKQEWFNQKNGKTLECYVLTSIIPE